MEKTAVEYDLPEGIDASDIVDLRGLEAPEPMVRILEAGTRLGPGERYLALLPHVPHPLFPHLETRGLAWQICEQADGCAVVVIRRRD